MASPKRRLFSRTGPVGVAVAVFRIWRRLPPKQRKQALKLARKHGPKVVRAARNFKKKR